MKKLIKKVKVAGEIECLSGLHIGGNAESAGIGDVDNPVIRTAIGNQPYIPGSSLKGKIRSLLQVAHGEKHERQTQSIICQLFGASENNKQGNRLEGNASRVIFRDAKMTAASVQQLKDTETDMPFTEVKWENRIDRVKGKAEHPRQQERVPAGTRFEVEIMINIFEDDNEQELVNLLKSGIAMLEDDYLGGNGSRGSGRVKLHIEWDKVEHKTIESYLQHG